MLYPLSYEGGGPAKAVSEAGDDCLGAADSPLNWPEEGTRVEPCGVLALSVDGQHVDQHLGERRTTRSIGILLRVVAPDRDADERRVLTERP
jgi:hypothetical protein